jgi:hypothetical protein
MLGRGSVGRWAVVRSPMERLMALWKTEHDFQPHFTLRVPARALDLAALFASVAAPVLLLLWAVPLPLVLPALSIGSFIIACVVALFAHCSAIDRTAPGLTPWNIVAVRVRRLPTCGPRAEQICSSSTSKPPRRSAGPSLAKPKLLTATIHARDSLFRYVLRS